MKTKEFNFKKKYGQNFLIDKSVLQKIMQSISPGEEDLIIEIGSGTGNLTKELKKYNSILLGYEIDLDTKPFLDNLIDDKTSFIYGDFLRQNIIDDIKDIKYENLYIVGNLPYYITTPIITKIAKEDINFNSMILMMQKEVGERLSSLPKNKEYGYITVYLNYFFEINKLFDVNRTSFKPIPNVDSSILQFIPSKKSGVKDEKHFVTLLKSSFSQKRKTLLNNLKNYDKETIGKILDDNGISRNARAEELDIEIFIEISNKLLP